MSVHRECGEEITWLRREDDPSRYMPPLEYAGEVFVKNPESGNVYMTHAYRRHNCDPDKMIAWQDYQRRLAEAKGEEYTPYDAARERERESLWELALEVDCRRCEQPAGMKCRSLQRTHVNSGEFIETRNPHPVRIEDGIKKKDDE